jgi:SPP1 family predicted phage head-tail adaptor
MLSQRDLQLMRHTIADNLGDLATIQNYTDASDGQGGVTRTWANTYTNVPCRLAPKSSHTQTEGGQYQAVTGWVLTVRYDQTIAAGDRVVKSGDTFEVLSVEDDRTDRVLRRAFLRRQDG